MTPLSAKWSVALFVGVLVITTLVFLLPTDEPKEPPPLPPAPAEEPSPSAAPPATAVIDPQTWETVEDLSTITGDWRVQEDYDMAGARLRISGGSEASLYPYSLRFEPGVEDKRPLDCGFYSRLEDDWRLGYCTGYTLRVPGAVPHRIGFHVNQSGGLRYQAGDLLELYLVRDR